LRDEVEHLIEHARTISGGAVLHEEAPGDNREQDERKNGRATTHHEPA